MAFSAGIDKDNLADAVALGLTPVTICSDLLKPGGYGRMAQGLRKLVKTMKSRGHDRACGPCGARPKPRRPKPVTATRCRPAARHLATHEGAEPYALAATGKPLRQVDTRSARCSTAWPAPTASRSVPTTPSCRFPPRTVKGLEARAQYLVLAELCNDCGNCTTFCPEEGAPHLIKPRLFTDPAAWESAGRQGFLLNRTPDKPVSVQGAEDEKAQLVETLVLEEKWLKACLKEGPR